jgi:transposase
MTLPKTTHTQIDSSKENHLIGCIITGESVHHAGKMIGISASSANRIWKKFLATGSTTNLPCSGHPPKVTDHARRRIVRTAVKDRRMPFQEIANSLKPKISDATVRNVLSDEGYHRRVARKVPYLGMNHKPDRMHWARKYKPFDDGDWQYFTLPHGFWRTPSSPPESTGI